MPVFNQELIDAVRLRAPEKGNAANLLMEILPIGKEAVYRRLRGEIPFTLQEAVTICKKLEISLDFLMGIKQKDNYTFHLNAIFLENSMSQLHKLMNEIIDSVNHVKMDPDSINYRVHNSIPHDFLFRYDSLTKVFLYSLFYQLYPYTTPRNLSEIKIPESVSALLRESTIVIEQINSIVILDKYSFSLFADTINYYRELNMISEEDILAIKEELHLLINEMEKYTVIGESSYGKKISVFLSQKSFDCSYTYMKGRGMEACSVRLYGLDYLSCDNAKVCEAHKRWIDSLMRFSTLISVSGEMHRNEYFSNQRRIVDSL